MATMMLSNIVVAIVMIGLMVVGYRMLRNILVGFAVQETRSKSFGHTGTSLADLHKAHVTQDYKIFTTEYDVELRAHSLWNELGIARESMNSSWREAHLRRTKRNVRCDAYEFRDDSKQKAQDFLVTVLIDQSGSTRGKVALEFASSVGVLCENLQEAGCFFEVLGFTTRSWQGGMAREKWRQAGAPPMPGRLCDLLHIVYKSISDNFDECKSDLLLSADTTWLRENVDGEAILWAKSRFDQSGLKNWICVVVSDGAPVDDSTLDANRIGDKYPILHDHLKSVVASISAEDNCTIASLGVGYDPATYYGLSRHVTKLEDILDELCSLTKDAISKAS
jgi:cobaltochelatase CobT